MICLLEAGDGDVTKQVVVLSFQYLRSNELFNQNPKCLEKLKDVLQRSFALGGRSARKRTVNDLFRYPTPCLWLLR